MRLFGALRLQGLGSQRRPCDLHYTSVLSPRTLRFSTLIVNPIKLETGLRPNSAGITYTLLLRIEAMGFPTFGLLL